MKENEQKREKTKKKEEIVNRTEKIEEKRQKNAYK